MDPQTTCSDVKNDIIILGDFCPYSTNHNKNLKFSDALMTLLAQSQVVSVNLECPITDSDQVIDKSGPALKADISALDLLKKLNVSICSIANNHIMDYRDIGVNDTIRHITESGMDFVGVEGVPGKAHIIKVINGKKIAFISFTENEFSTMPINGIQAIAMDYAAQYQQVKAAKLESDYVIIQYHGGIEMYDYPTPKQVIYARHLIDIGADAVICHHSHCVSGYEQYQGRMIFYGLGNFYFPEDGNERKWYSGMGLTLTITDVLEFELFEVSYHIGENQLTHLMHPSESMNKHLRDLNGVISSPKLISDKWREMCENNVVQTLKTLYKPGYLIRILMKLGFKNLLNKKTSNGLMNTLRCESLYEKTLTTLEIVQMRKV